MTGWGTKQTNGCDVSVCDYSYGQWNHERSSVRLDWLLSPGIRRTPIVDTSSQRRPTNQNQFRRSSLPWRQSCIDSTHTYPAPKLEIAIMCITLWQVHFGKAGMFSRYVCCVAIAISIRVHHFNQHKSRNQHSGRQVAMVVKRGAIGIWNAMTSYAVFMPSVPESSLCVSTC